jgi:PAS domain S-box-containing protein
MTDATPSPALSQAEAAALRARIADLEAALQEKEAAEAGLRRSQAMLARTESIAHVGSWEWEVATDTVTWSDELFRIFQLAPALVAPSYAEHPRLYHPHDMARLSEAVETALRTGAPYELDLRAIRADGETRVCVARGHAEVGPDGSVTRLFGSLQDITERKRAEENLKKYENIVSCTPDGMALLDENYRYTIVNDAYETFSGVKREQFIGKTVAEYLGDEVFRQSVKPNFDRCLRGETITYQEWFEFPTLGRRFVEVTYFPYRDWQNSFTGIVAVTRDITGRKQMEEALRQSEANLQSLFNAIDESISLFDREGKILAVNQTFAERVGLSVAACLGQSVYSLIPPEVAARRHALIAEAIHNRQPVVFEDERWGRWLHHSVFPVLNAQGEVERLAIYAIDITGRKQAEEKISHLLERLNLAARAARLGIWDWDIQKNELVWDDQMYALYGTNRADFTGAYEAWLAGLHPDDVAANDEISQQARRGEREYDPEFRVVWPTGQVRFIKAVGQVIRDEAGQPVRMIGVNYDITERKQTEAALRQSEQNYREIFNATTEAIFIHDAITGQILDVNDSMLKMYGFASKEEAQASMVRAGSANVSPYTPAEALQKIKLAASGQPQVFEWLAVKKNDELFWAEVSLRSALIGGQDRVLAVSRDITRRKQAEEALRDSESRLKITLEATQIATWEWDVARDIWYASPQYFTMLGYPPETGPSDRAVWLGRVHPADREATAAKNKRGLAGLDSHNEYEARMRHTDGSYRWHRVLGHTVESDEANRPTRMLGVRMDVTERKQAEEALRSRENFLQRIFDVLPIGLWLADKEGQLLRGNPAGVKIWGSEPLVPPAEYSVFKARRLPSGQEIMPDDWALTHTIREGVTVADEMLEIEAFDGVKRIILNYTAPVLDDQGAIEGAIIVNQDITERKQAEEAIRRSEQNTGRYSTPPPRPSSLMTP